MKKIHSILALIGVIIWSLAIFLRGTPLMDNDIIKWFSWVAPNFGVVWAGVGFTYLLYPRIRKKEFEPKYTLLLVGIILVFLLLAEVIHHFFLDSSFDIWDIVASAIAAIIVIGIYIFKKHRDDHFHFRK